MSIDDNLISVDKEIVGILNILGTVIRAEGINDSEAKLSDVMLQVSATYVYSQRG